MAAWRLHRALTHDGGRSFVSQAAVLRTATHLSRGGVCASPGLHAAAAHCTASQAAEDCSRRDDAPASTRQDAGAGEWPGSEVVSTAGSIEVVIGPMFSGKTSALLRRIDFHEAAKRRALAVKSDKDDRYGLASLNTHCGLSKACYAVSELQQLKKRWPREYEMAQVIAIDEAQFFPDLQDFCLRAADEDSKHVIVAGLDGDFRRQRFGQVDSKRTGTHSDTDQQLPAVLDVDLSLQVDKVLDLVPCADAVTKLWAQCSYCQAEGQRRKAPFSLRIAADERQEVVGGADKYAPVCRRHYRELSRVRRAPSGAVGG